MLGILWKDLKELKASILILIGILVAVTVIAVLNLERLDHFSFCLTAFLLSFRFSSR